MGSILRKTLFISFILLAFASCSSFGNKEYDQQLKSPCAGAGGSPCQHIPVNNWWLSDDGKTPLVFAV